MRWLVYWTGDELRWCSLLFSPLENLLEKAVGLVHHHGLTHVDEAAECNDELTADQGAGIAGLGHKAVSDHVAELKREQWYNDEKQT